jgi:sugar phosphate isomerase/epimerase
MLTRCLDVGRDLGASVVAFWSGVAPAGADVAELDRRLAAGCLAVADAAQARGLVAAFEPEPGMHVATLADWTRLRGAARHPALRLALDVGHVHCNREGDPAGSASTPPTWDVQIEDMREERHLTCRSARDARRELGRRRVARTAYAGLVGVEMSRDSHRVPTSRARRSTFSDDSIRRPARRVGVPAVGTRRDGSRGLGSSEFRRDRPSGWVGARRRLAPARLRC